MTDYLIRHITDSTSHTFTEVIKPRENERYEIVSAESREEALEIAKRAKGLLEVVPSSFNSCRCISKPIPDRKHATPPRVEDYFKK